jgi:hypothetical protein
MDSANKNKGNFLAVFGAACTHYSNRRILLKGDVLSQLFFREIYACIGLEADK